MPRRPRFNLPGIPQHVIQRGNNRAPCFYSESDYACYLDAAERAATKYGCRIHAYVLMTNHVHLLVTPTAEHAISKLMQDLGRKYVRYFNGAYRRSGTLWEGRYRASLVDSDRYLLTCMRYIELNPVRAGMVRQPSEYQWSSYRANAHGLENTALAPHPLYSALGNNAHERQVAYRDLFRTALPEIDLEEIRMALSSELVLGGSRFKDYIEAATKRAARRGRPGRPKAH